MTTSVSAAYNLAHDFDQRGRVAVLVGGDGGLGSAISTHLASLGATVVIGYYPTGNRDAAHRLARALPADNRQRHLAAPVDITDGQSVQAFLDAAGRVDICVNTAGFNTPMPSVDLPEDLWDKIIDIDLKGVFLASQAAARQMIAQGGADRTDARYSIVSISSQQGLVGQPRRAAYCAAKAGVINLSRVLAIEWVEHGIRVNTVAPTVIETPLTAALLQTEAYRTETLTGSPLGVIGRPNDVASAVGYLCSRNARLVTGATLVVDGGWTI